MVNVTASVVLTTNKCSGSQQAGLQYVHSAIITLGFNLIFRTNRTGFKTPGQMFTFVNSCAVKGA